MSLNNISLSPQLLAELYHRSLVEGNAHTVHQKKAIPFLGQARKHILIIVSHKAAPFLPDKELAFLTTVLSACGLDLSHVAIVNWHTIKENGELVLEQFQPKQILFLDVAPEVVGFPSNLPYYKVLENNTVQFVAAPSLSEIEKTKPAKSQLWISLKQLFCL